MEFFDHFTSFIVLHRSEYEWDFLSIPLESIKKFFSKISWVNKDDCFRLQIKTVYDVCDTVDLRSLITADVWLFDVVKLQLFLLLSYYVCLIYNFRYLQRSSFIISGRKENVLNWLRQLFKYRCDFHYILFTCFILKVFVCFI